MKRIFFLAAITTATVLSCNNATENKDSEPPKNAEIWQENLKGKVQNYTEETYATDSATGAIGKKDSLTIKLDFDKKGYITRYAQNKLDGKVSFEQTLVRYDNGAVKEVINKKDGKQSARITVEADKDGNYTGAKSYDSAGKQDSYYTDLKTDDYGMLYAGKQYFTSGKIKATFDGKTNKGQVISSTSTDSTGKTDYSSSTKFNDKGDPSEKTTTTVAKDSSTTKVVTYKYDSFDSTGNWTQRTSFEKGKPTSIAKRTYTYYKD